MEDFKNYEVDSDEVTSSEVVSDKINFSIGKMKVTIGKEFVKSAVVTTGLSIGALLIKKKLNKKAANIIFLIGLGGSAYLPLRDMRRKSKDERGGDEC